MGWQAALEYVRNPIPARSPLPEKLAGLLRGLPLRRLPCDSAASVSLSQL